MKTKHKTVTRKKGLIHEIQKNWELYLMLLPALLYIILFSYKPMGGVLMAFQDFSLKKGLWGSEWIGLGNFERLFNSYWFPIALKNTLTLSVLGLLLGFPVPILLALVFNELTEGKGKKIVQTITYAPHFISTVVMCGMLLIFLNPEYGILNIFLNLIGVDSVYFMSKPELFKWIYVLSGIWSGSGWGAIIYIAALSGVDKNLLEAAKIDGANRFQRVRYINFPVMIPTIVIMLILNCGSILSVGYEKVYLLQNEMNLSSSEVLSTYAYKVGLENSDYAFSAAVGLFNSVVNGFVLVMVNKLSAKISDSSLW